MARPISKDKSMEKNLNPSPPTGIAPPAYNASPSNLTAAFSNLNLNAAQNQPTKDRCIAHLKLLEAFHQLREDIATTDGLFGIKDSWVPAELSQRAQAAVLFKIREKRWAVYVAKAASRFETWWEKSIQPDSRMLRQADIENSALQEDHARGGDEFLPFTPDNLPPLDVIMVWHAYMLNPRAFLEDCLRYGKIKLWRTGLPWAAIDSHIDNETLEYSGTGQAQKFFESGSGLAWDSLNDPPNAALECPKCKRILSCPWTTCDESFFLDSAGGELGQGFADKDFEFCCDFCRVTIDHGVLRTQKFRRDLKNLLLKDIPMPGTILSLDGVSSLIAETEHLAYSPANTSKKRFIRANLALEEKSVLFPNRVIKGGLSTNLLECTDVRQHKTTTVNGIRTEFEGALTNQTFVRMTVSGTGRLGKPEKIAIRRMMSRYWDNSSTFALDLVGAVIRQGTFIEKMHSIDWVHSPTVGATMTRLIEKYGRYFEILAKYPDHVAVPTLDVDLAWHTHQLTPQSYYVHSLRNTKIFIDHDDKIEENKLSEAFAWTSKIYQKMFSSVYSECTCWYCEATRETSNSLVYRHTKEYKRAESELDNIRASKADTSNPHTGPHISAHNAVRSDKSDKGSTIRASMTAAYLEGNYQKASKRARKRGREPPERDSYMYAMAYGYPMYMPYYAPYIGDPCVTGDLYPGNPSCANFALGAAGNCCQGACGGGVAAGACGGSGGSACGAGCAGGACGGGGSGGGCGGGGGGGCGGGGGGCGGGG